MTNHTFRLAVMGNPVNHSKSPMIHDQFAREAGLNISYEKILAPLDSFSSCVDAFVGSGAVGFNVTVPFKFEAFQLVGELTESAARASAVNTVRVNEDGSLDGHNTDGGGLLRDISDNLGWSLEGRKVLVLGAGGAVAGVLFKLLQAQPDSVDIWNRTHERATELSSRFEGVFARRSEELAQGYDVVINGTSAGLSQELPSVPASVIAPHTCCYDMVYSSGPTRFNGWAIAQGAAQTSDGLGMLVEQAALAFEYWFGKLPTTRPVIDLIRTGT